MTIKDLLAKLEKHEAECSIHLENINRRLEAGSEKFKFQQNTIWGLYAFIAGVWLLDKLI